MRCPSVQEITVQMLALLPRGRAWRSHRQDPEETSTLWQYWRSVAEPVHYLVDRICALRLEFWCASETLTHDSWLTEYGLPDTCDPFPELCAKVAALGGANCSYYQDVAARGMVD